MTATDALVLDEVRPLAERFARSGFTLYLVGGIVRDLQLGVPLEELDFDFTTDAQPAQIRKVVGPIADAVWTQGERFGTIGCKIGGRAYEITTHRAEWYSTASRKPEVSFGDDVVVDLSRRDFTVNAMARRLPEGELVDPFDGRAALAERRLTTPIDPAVSFGDDPLRILRAARFIARYALVPDPDVVAAAERLVDRLEIVSAERIRDELDKVLTSERPGSGIDFLRSIGAMEHLLQHVAAAADAVGELAAALDRSPVELLVRRTIVFSACAPSERRRQLQALRYSKEDMRTILALLGGIDHVAATTHWPEEEVRRLVDSVGLDRMAALIAAGEALETAGAATLRGAFEDLAAREDLTSFEPNVTGEQVMAALGVGEGPAVGRMLDALRERRLRLGPATAAEELEFLQRRER